MFVKMADYTKLFLLGSGTYGQAWVVHETNSCDRDRKKVMKEVSLENLSTKDINQAVTEAEVLAECKHENIIKYIEAFVVKNPLSLCIVMEYAACGDVHKCITQRNGLFFPNETVHQWVEQLMAALNYIHARGILHRDVKPHNLFLSDQHTLKLGDFGIARILQTTTDKAHTFIGTPFYLSPEIYNQQPYSFKSDMWSAGCVVYELCSLQVPFTGCSLGSLAAKVERGLFAPLPSHCDQSLQLLVKRLLHPDPEERPSAKDVVGMLTSTKTGQPTAKDQMEKAGSDGDGVRGRSAARGKFASKVDSTTYTVVRHPKVRKLSLASPELSTMLHRQRTQSAERSRSASCNTPKGSPKPQKTAPCFNILQSSAAHDGFGCEDEENGAGAAKAASFKSADTDQGSSDLIRAVYQSHQSSPDGLHSDDVLRSLKILLGTEQTEWLVCAVRQKASLEEIQLTCGTYLGCLPLVLLYVHLVDNAR